MDGNQIYVTDTGDYHSAARVVRINAQSGRQTVIASGEYLLTPVGIAIEEAVRSSWRMRPRLTLTARTSKAAGMTAPLFESIQKTATKHSLLAGTVHTLTHERSSWSQAVRRASKQRAVGQRRKGLNHSQPSSAR